ncbi:hypothetical protein ACJMK2_012660 [Sinanodonta woodiana]|uniref:ZMYM2-like/QRICH1 C-terminal domain-containing protein n=1 Tax=Sinanodonta woodiana TaxID=1069815 RepID=A0ABD3V8W3_SINWO
MYEVSSFVAAHGINPEDCSQYKEESSKTHTKTCADIKLMQMYLLQKGEARAMEDIPLNVLDEYISAFLCAGRKKNGEEYSWASLRSFVASLERYLRQRNVYTGSIIKGRDFRKCRSYLEAKKLYYSRGKPRIIGSIDERAVEHLYDTEKLGMGSPVSLINALSLICVQWFRLKTAWELHALQWRDIQILSDEEGREFLACLSPSRRKNADSCERVYATPNRPERNPVAIYRFYASRRPRSMLKPNSPFFLIINVQPSCSDSSIPWFRLHGMGINSLRGVLAELRKQLSDT